MPHEASARRNISGRLTPLGPEAGMSVRLQIQIAVLIVLFSLLALPVIA
jgi:hypothetical protein